MDPDQTERMRRLVWIHVDRKRTMLVLSWCGSFAFDLKKNNEGYLSKIPVTELRHSKLYI
jgi:hypothetical protein